ncbi:META domain-containing protein [Alkalimarinus coralli]|uniref:META domain-containing protein n=1 Tax=Alkalimarinus coralli TaxID=2935863 RepID=UPI00202B13ED|nr:META domain-containing protein [Alkalimarinus coralli]
MKSTWMLILASFLVAACSTYDYSPIPVSVKALQHHNWELTHIDGKEIPVHKSHQRPRLEIGENFTANGLAGCNSFFGQASLRQGKEFRIEKMGLTRKMCPESVMEIEQAVSETLSSWSGISLTKERLTLTGQQHVLRFRLRDWVN